MGGPTGWRSRQYLTLLTVAAVHAGLLALFLAASGIRVLGAPSDAGVQVVLLAPEPLPRMKIAHLSLPSLHSARSITIGPTVSEVPSLPMSGSSGDSSNADGNDVDWSAEARRALRAFDIRSHLPTTHKSVSTRPEDESWLPGGAHRSGEQFKTPSGDWIVWIDANCYQIASSTANVFADAEQSQIVCRRQAPMRQ
jgi:hypothetical protein